jgi:hypothetical protein
MIYTFSYKDCLVTPDPDTVRKLLNSSLYLFTIQHG